MAQVRIEKIEQTQRKRTKFVSIRVPPHVHRLARQVAEKTGKKIYVVVHDALSMYLSYLRKPYSKSELPKIDKISWYILKLASSWGSFRENPTPENAERLKTVARQILSRMAVDTSDLIDIIEKWLNKHTKKLTSDDRMEFNACIKLIIATLITTLFEEEE